MNAFDKMEILFHDWRFNIWRHAQQEVLRIRAMEFVLLEHNWF